MRFTYSLSVSTYLIYRLSFFLGLVDYRLVQIAPPVKDLFPFLKGSNEVPKNNAQLEAQALRVFKTVIKPIKMLKRPSE